jgi:hypothetical protein
MLERALWVVGLLFVAFATHASVPGGVAVVELPSDAYAAWFDGRPVMVLPGPEPVAVVGIPLSAGPGTLHIVVDADSGSFEQPFEVRPKSYPEQHITIKDQRMVTPVLHACEKNPAATRRRPTTRSRSSSRSTAVSRASSV